MSLLRVLALAWNASLFQSFLWCCRGVIWARFLCFLEARVSGRFLDIADVFLMSFFLDVSCGIIGSCTIVLFYGTLL